MGPRLRRLCRLYPKVESRIVFAEIKRRSLFVAAPLSRQSTKFMEQFSSSQLRIYLGQLRDAIADGQTSGAFTRQINPTLAAKALFGALDEMATNWILSKRRYDLASEADAVVDLFVNGLAT